MKRSLAMLALLLGCEQGPHFVALDLRTDLVVSREADTLEITVDDGEPMEIELESGENYLDGARVLELAMLEPGPHRIDVDLRRGGSSLVRRPISVDVGSDLVVTAVLTRDCRGVECPAGDNPTATACLGGTCVPDTCIPEADDVEVIRACAAANECDADADCVSDAPCGGGVCAEGVCIFESRDDMCSAERPFCDPDIGCRDGSTYRGLWSLWATTDTLYYTFSISGDGTVDGVTYDSIGSADLFVQAREPDGMTVRWTRQIGSDSSEYAEDLDALATGELLVGGSAYSPESLEGVPLNEETEGHDGLVAVLDAATGDPIWGASLIGGGKTTITSVAAGPDDMIYAVVCYDADIMAGDIPLTSTRGQNWALIGYAPDMAGGWNASWALEIPAGEAAQLAASDAGVFLVGGGDEMFTLGATTTMATGERSAFFAHVDPMGAVQHVTAIGGGAWTNFSDIAVDPNGGLYAVGEIIGDATLGPDMLTPNGDDVLLVSLLADGTVSWARAFGGPSDDRGVRVVFDVNDGSLAWMGMSARVYDLGGTTVGTDDGENVPVAARVDLTTGDVISGATIPGDAEGFEWPAPTGFAVTADGEACITGRAAADLDPIFYRGRNTAGHLSCATLFGPTG